MGLFESLKYDPGSWGTAELVPDPLLANPEDRGRLGGAPVAGAGLGSGACL